MPILDHRTDISRRMLIKLAYQLTEPETARVLALGLRRGDVTEKKIFAWKTAGMFPLDTPEDTILSRLYFGWQKNDLPKKVASQIENALGVYETLHRIESPLHLCKNAQHTSQPILSEELLPGIKVASDEDIHRADADFAANYKKLPLDARRRFAEKLCKTASTRNIQTSNIVNLFAGRGQCDAQRTKKMIALRKLAAERRGADGTVYERLVASLTEDMLASADMENLCKLASCLHELDASHGLPAGVPDAWQSVFVLKKAELDSVQNSGQEKAPKDMTKADILARFGEGALEELENPDGSINLQRLENIRRLFSDGVDEAQHE